MQEALSSSVFLSSALYLAHYVTSRKVAGSRPDYVNGFFSIYLILPASISQLTVSRLSRQCGILNI
jgi:hypothetical protein